MARYIGRRGAKRVTEAVLITSIPPLMLKTAANPRGLLRAWDLVMTPADRGCCVPTVRTSRQNFEDARAHRAWWLRNEQ